MNPYDLQLAGLQNKQSLINAMLQRSLQPQNAGPVGALGQVLSAYLGGQALNGINTQQQDIAQQQQNDRQKTLAQALSAYRGDQPFTPDMFPGETPQTLSGQQTPNLMNQGTGVNPAAMAQAMMTSNQPDLQKAGMNVLLGTKKSDMPSSIQEWQYYNALPKADQERYLQMKRAQQFLNQGNQYGAPMMTDPTKVVPVAPINPKVSETPAYQAEQTKAKGQAESEVKKETGFPKVTKLLQDQNQQWDNINQYIDKALNQIGITTAGPAGKLAWIPGSGAKDLSATLDTIKANIGFDTLNQMRASSPTGGALGQVSEMENKLLQAVKGSMDQTQSPDQLRENLMNIKAYLAALRQRTNDAYQHDYGNLIQTNSVNDNSIKVNQPNIEDLVNKYAK